MRTFAVYQIDDSHLHNEINRLGWEEAMKQYPKVQAKQDLRFFGSEKFTTSMLKHFSLVAFVEGNDPEDVFKLTNAPEEFLENDFGPNWSKMIKRLDNVRMYSLSVGDIVTDLYTGEMFMVEDVGFKKLENV